ncbi:MAG: iron response transcriptional regulator IrrA [Candidatus Puniceispirillaceae bacterium]
MMINERQKGTQKPEVSTLADFAKQLRLVGLRPTRQRVAIAALLLDGRHRHVSADSLTEEITAAGLRVSGGTVYNTLNQFTNAGLLRRVLVHNEYSLFDTNTDHHHHFYEASNDQLVDIPNDDLVLAKLPKAPDGHEIKAVDVIIHIQSK